MVYSESLVSIPEAGSLVGMADPVVTASIYCRGRADQTILRPLAGIRQQIAAELPAESFHLWFTRYRKCGEHIKLRIHAPAEYASRLRDLVAGTLEPFLAALPPSPPEAEADAQSRRVIPAIDAEDQSFVDYPDRTLLWTTYQRSYVSLGGRPLLDDDTYVLHLTRWLAASADWIFEDLKLGEDLQVAHRQRQNLLIKMLLSALGTLQLTPEQRATYLQYHRDWLIRFILLKVVDREEKAEKTLEGFDQQVDSMSSMFGPIERTINRLWGQDQKHSSPLRLLADHIETFRGNPAYQIDPFSTETAFPGIFKGFHGSANQVGVSKLNEALTHHLLLRVVAPEKAATPVRLMPD